MIHGYIESLKSSLRNLGQNPAPVIDGPVDFALNSQYERAEFICVSEGEMTITEFLESAVMYKFQIPIEIGIRVERSPADNENKHITRARMLFDDVWQALGGLLVSGFQIIRQSGRREPSDESNAVVYTINCTLNTTEDERTCL